MTTVHLGRQRGGAGFARTVAIKRPHPDLAKDPEFAAEWDRRHLARRIRALRVARNFTQQEIAERSGTTQSAIARLESGARWSESPGTYQASASQGANVEVSNPTEYRPRNTPVMRRSGRRSHGAEDTDQSRRIVESVE